MGVLAAIAIGVGVYFGVANKSSGSGSSQTLNVGQASAASATLTKRAIFARAATAPSSLFGSTDAFNYAEVVGIKLNVINIGITSTDASVVSITPPTGRLTFGSGVTEQNLTQGVTIPAGTYNRVSVNLKNSYSLKAYCKTSSAFVYTTASGIKVANLSTTSAPSDFDYYNYPFAWPAIAKSATDASQNTEPTSIDTISNFNVTANSTINLLVDTNFVVTCYDGTLSAFNSSAISPFNNGPSNSGIPLATFFPVGSPNFGILGFPLFIYIGDDSSLVKAETYLVSSTAISGAITPSDALAVTIAFQPSGAVLGVKGRNAVSAVTGLENDMYGETNTASTYNIYSGAYSTTNRRIIVNRKVHNFTRLALDGSTSYSVLGGADCGGSFTDNIGGQSHQRSKACPSTNITSYWKRTK